VVVVVVVVVVAAMAAMAMVLVMVMVTRTVLWGRIVVVATMVDHNLVRTTMVSVEGAHRIEAGTW